MCVHRSIDRRHRAVALLLGVVVVLAACSGDSDDDSGGDGFDTSAATAAELAADATETIEAPADTEAPAVEAPTEDEGESSAAAGAGPGVVPAAVTAADLGRDIVYTADVELEVEDVAVASQRAVAAIEALGGVVFGQDATNRPTPRAVFTFKVLPEDFQAALAALGELGVPRTQTVSADDVTERVVDLESRIRTSETSVERLRGLLEQTGDLDEIARLEAQLLDRETQLELLRGQLRTLQDQVTLATIVAVLTQDAPEPSIEVNQTAHRGSLDEGACPADDDLTVDEGEPFVLCAAVVNTGDTMLADVELRDDTHDVDPDDVTVVSGDAALIAPGERVVLAYEAIGRTGTPTAVRIDAGPVDAAGNELGVELIEDVEVVELTVEPDESLPGFRDALAAGTGVLAMIGGVLVILAGAVLPFVWLVPVVWLALRWRRRRPAVS